MLFFSLLYVFAQYTAIAAAINATSLSWYDPQLPGLNATLQEEVFARRSYFYVGGKYINGVIQSTFSRIPRSWQHCLDHWVGHYRSDVCREIGTSSCPPRVPYSVHHGGLSDSNSSYKFPPFATQPLMFTSRIGLTLLMTVQAGLHISSPRDTLSTWRTTLKEEDRHGSWQTALC